MGLGLTIRFLGKIDLETMSEDWTLTFVYRIIGNLAAGTSSPSELPHSALYAVTANFDICAWDEFKYQMAASCINMIVEDNVAAGSSDFGFLLQVSSPCPSPYRKLDISVEIYCKHS